MLIPSLEALFLSIKKYSEIQGIEIFDHCYLYSAYTDDTTFLLKNESSIGLVVKTFETSSEFSGFKPNISKCEIAGIGALKWIPMAACGMKSIDLTTDFIRTLGLIFPTTEK